MNRSCPRRSRDLVATDRRASAYGIFTGGYGIAWFAGSVLMGMLYDHSITAAVVFCVVVQLAAVPMLIAMVRRTPAHGASN